MNGSIQALSGQRSYASSVYPDIDLGPVQAGGCTLNADAAMGYSSMPGLAPQFLNMTTSTKTSYEVETHTISGVPDGNELERE